MADSISPWVFIGISRRVLMKADYSRSMESLSRVRARHMPGGTGIGGDENAGRSLLWNPSSGSFNPESSNAHGFVTKHSGFADLSQTFIEKYLKLSPPMQVFWLG
jgi:hypothetical protein